MCLYVCLYDSRICLYDSRTLLYDLSMTMMIMIEHLQSRARREEAHHRLRLQPPEAADAEPLQARASAEAEDDLVA